MILLIFGSQYGDEGKGKIIDYLAGHFDYIVRCQGGNNAGHIIYDKDVKKTLSLLPSGVLHKNCKNIITSGVAINPYVLLKEIKSFENNSPKVLISDRAHIILTYHMAMDKLWESIKKKSIGTTLKGIGACYSDKMNRIGIRICDLFNKKRLYELIQQNLLFKNILFEKYGFPVINAKQITNEYYGLAKKLKKYVCNTSLLLNEAIHNNKSILFEGAQGAMLCIEHGTYPYVTSSSPLPNAVSINSGIAPKFLNNSLAVIKAYTSRVGNGFLITEFENDITKILRETGNEYGSVTKRPRRIGWLDLVQLKNVKQLTNFNYCALTLLDVLSSLEKIKICVAYKYKNKIINYIPASIDIYKLCKPIYKEFDGWKTDISTVDSYDNLPENCKKYISFIENELNIIINIISIGKKRSQTLFKKDIFNGK